jgi:hypothetical protein
VPCESLFTRLWPERPPPEGQQQEQHLQQQHASSAPQQTQRATQKTTDRIMSPPTIMATITGHLLWIVSAVLEMTAICSPIALGHALVPRRERVFGVRERIANCEVRHPGWCFAIWGRFGARDASKRTAHTAQRLRRL